MIAHVFIISCINRTKLIKENEPNETRGLFV